MVTFRNHNLQEWLLRTLVFYCPKAVYRPSFVLCAGLLYGNRVVWMLCSLFLTAIYRSGVFGHFNLYAITVVYRRCVFALHTRDTLLTVIYRCGVFSFHIVKYDCWSVNVVLNFWDGLGTSRLLGKLAWAFVVMDVCHLITTQMIVIRWSPYKENVLFARSSRWRVCAYVSYVWAKARTWTTLYCTCIQWSDDWEQRKWMALYVPARKISNTV